jgi:MFS family permease
MALLILSTLFESDTAVAFGLLLVATAFLGVGFGLTVPALNTLTAAFHPRAVDSSVLTLNALLGLGTALAPVFVAIFVGLGFWWGLPVMSAVLLTGLVLFSVRLPLRAGERAPTDTAAAPAGIPSRFWVFAAFAVLYGVCETVNGNWSQLDMTGELGASTTEAALALTAFWAMVTVGRILVAAAQRWVPVRLTYHVLPFLLAGTFVIIALLPRWGCSRSASPASGARRCCRSRSASVRRSWPRSPPQWPGASSRSTNSATGSRRSASAHSWTRGSSCPPSTASALSSPPPQASSRSQ